MPDKPLKEKLLEKGWSEAEAERVHHLVHSPEKQEKHLAFKKEINKVTYWMIIIVLAVLNFLIAIVLIPILILSDALFIELILVFVGLVFGWLFDTLIKDIEHVEIKHHAMAAAIIPFFAIINMFIVSAVANGFARTLNLGVQNSPFLLSLAYVLPFLLPYSITLFREHVRKS